MFIIMPLRWNLNSSLSYQEMKPSSAEHLISAAHNSSPVKYPFNFINPFRSRKIGPLTRNFSITMSSKQNDFQDYQRFAKPSRLLPAEEVKIGNVWSPQNFVEALSVDGSQSCALFKVKTRTSSIYDSCLSDLNAGVLLCLIDENDDSILQRISASSNHSTESEDANISDLCFQRGSVDEFTFKGPQLGSIKALWVGLESGRWRLGGISLAVVNRYQHSSEEPVLYENLYTGIQYDFEADDILIGEGSEISVSELRPCLLTEFSSGADPLALLSETFSQPDSRVNWKIPQEESMKEYANLKFSLLLYDVMLIFSGTSVLSFSTGEKAAAAFLTGGFGGLLFLLLLQRSVDGIQASTQGSGNAILRGFRSPVLALALAVGLAVLAVKYGVSTGVPVVLTPEEVVAGMMGFLVCKVAVVLVTVKPLPFAKRSE